LLVDCFDAPPLGALQRLWLRLRGVVRVGWIVSPGWRGWLPAYAVRCDRDGVVVPYAMGFEGLLMCPLCLEEERA